MWHVVSVSTRQEIETASRINSAGFVAHCPTYQKKYARHRGGRYFSRSLTVPLFPGYIFVSVDDAFRKDLFERANLRLMVFRKNMISEGQMAVINSTALDLTLAQSKTHRVLPIKRGDVMQILHGAMQGEPVEVLEARREKITVILKRFAGAFPITINASSLGRAV